MRYSKKKVKVPLLDLLQCSLMNPLLLFLLHFEASSLNCGAYCSSSRSRNRGEMPLVKSTAWTNQLVAPRFAFIFFFFFSFRSPPWNNLPCKCTLKYSVKADIMGWLTYDNISSSSTGVTTVKLKLLGLKKNRWEHLLF